jgi:hypothetical protein
MQSIEIDEVEVESFCDLFRQRGFPGTSGANDDNAFIGEWEHKIFNR